jgi:hypothetical protein
MIAQTAAIKSHRAPMDSAETPSLRMPNNGENRIFERTQRKSVTSMDLEQRHGVKFLDSKGLTLDLIIAKRSNTSGQDSHECSGTQ